MSDQVVRLPFFYLVSTSYPTAMDAKRYPKIPLDHENSPQILLDPHQNATLSYSDLLTFPIA
jgi:hypothetical protein